jgi:hypothetical protein
MKHAPETKDDRAVFYGLCAAPMALLCIILVQAQRFPLVERSGSVGGAPLSFGLFALATAIAVALWVARKWQPMRAVPLWLSVPMSLFLFATPWFFLQYATWKWANGALDRSGEHTVQTKVTGRKRSTYRGAASYQISLRDWRSISSTVSLRVTADEYFLALPGATARLSTRRGFLGGEWVVASRVRPLIP